MGSQKIELERLQEELEKACKERDQWRAEVEKLSQLYEAEKEYWLPLAFRLNDRSLEETLDDYDNLKERLAGNMSGQGHLSDKFQELRQAAEKFWAHADPNDPSTHPRRGQIEGHLHSLQWSEKMAAAGTSIIRPSWAPKGRPEKQ